jgi:hypothetical protein
MRYKLALFFLPLAALLAQEASSGVDLSATISGDGSYTHNPEAGSPVVGGFRAVLYPTWKVGEHWIVSGTVQVDSTPFFNNGISAGTYGVETRLLQGYVGYSRVWNKASLLIRAGELSTAFGSFLLRYDDAVNPLLAEPLEYGYYYTAVSNGSLAGAQADVTLGKWDGRLQLVNSSAANPRSILDKDQYPNWAAGAGYTPWQGLHIGVSGYRGPYLDRGFAFYFPGELRPRDLPATAVGADAEWAYGHWNVYGEIQHFEMRYHEIPTLLENAGYLELKRVLSPRWYVAARTGFEHTNYNSGEDAYEFAVGFRPNAHQLFKAGYTITRENDDGHIYKTLGVQMVTTIHPFSKSWN